MKLYVFLCVLAFVALSFATPQDYPRGCIYALTKCIQPCEEGTHGYSTGCGKRTPEATCDEPNPIEEEGIICDYTACYCDAPTVRDTTTDKCVELEKCPKKKPGLEEA